MKIKTFLLTTLLATNTCIYAKQTLDTGELGISNQTTRTLSFTINNICSTDIGNITGYSIKTINAVKIINACSESSTCDISAYDLPNCKGNEVGGVKIDFLNNRMQIVSKDVDQINIGGSIGLFEYNLFFNETYKPK